MTLWSPASDLEPGYRYRLEAVGDASGNPDRAMAAMLVAGMRDVQLWCTDTKTGVLRRPGDWPDETVRSEVVYVDGRWSGGRCQTGQCLSSLAGLQILRAWRGRPTLALEAPLLRVAGIGDPSTASTPAAPMMAAVGALLLVALAKGR